MFAGENFCKFSGWTAIHENISREHFSSIYSSMLIYWAKLHTKYFRKNSTFKTFAKTFLAQNFPTIQYAVYSTYVESDRQYCPYSSPKCTSTHLLIVNAAAQPQSKVLCSAMLLLYKCMHPGSAQY